MADSLVALAEIGRLGWGSRRMLVYVVRIASGDVSALDGGGMRLEDSDVLPNSSLQLPAVWKCVGVERFLDLQLAV